jgi:diphthine-ammonia ligase
VGIELTSGTQGGPRVVWQRLLLMKFVALLSGGKDSCYNILRCLDYGHELLCVGNLHPPLHLNVDETNSYMYQSAGYNMVPLIAECIGVPLICRELSGSAVTQSLDYEVTSLDEVEDLFELLKSVKVRPPSLLLALLSFLSLSFLTFL